MSITFLTNEDKDELLERIDAVGGGGTSAVNSINIKELGADNTGETDASEVIAYALRTFSRIFFPEGTYRVKGLVLEKSDVTIVGDNATLKIVNHDQCNLTGFSTDPNCLWIKSTDYANPIRNVEISGIHFNGNAQHFFDNGADTVDNFGNNGIVLTNTENVTIHHCTFNNFKGRGITSGVDNYDGVLTVVENGVPVEYASDEINWYGVHGLHVYECEFNNEPLPYKVVTIPAGEKYPTGGTFPGGKKVTTEKEVAAGTYHIMPHTNAIQILQSGGNECDSDILVERCTVHKSPNYGFMFYPSTQRLTIRKCTIMNCGLYTSEEPSQEKDGNGDPLGYIDYGYYRRSITKDDPSDHSDGSCIKLNTVRDVVIENNQLHSAKASNITIHTATENTYTNIGKKWENLHWPSTKNVVIRNNYLAGSTDQHRTGNGITVEAGEDIWIVGNTIVNQVGVAENHAVWGADVKFTKPTSINSNVPCLVVNNNIEDCSLGISMFSGLVSGNTIVNTHSPIVFATNVNKAIARDVIIHNNTINREATNYCVCIDLKGVENAIVSSNMISNFSRGVQLYETSNNVTVCENSFAGCSRPIIASINDANVPNGGSSSSHNNGNIYGNSFVKADGSEQTNYTIVWENVSNKGIFVPTNTRVNFTTL